LRLLDIEKPLKEAISSYITEVYPYTKGSPDVRVLDEEEFERENLITTWGIYDVTRNVIFFIGPAITQRESLYYKGRPYRFTIAHEIEHWAQCQRVGTKKYIEQLQDPKVYLQYEKSADEVALANAPKLKW